MSAMQRIHVSTTVVVDRATADVLRIEAKKVAMFEHDTFEDFVDFCPEAQHGLALRYRDVFDLIDAVGWDPDTADLTKDTYEVPLTEDLVYLLGRRRYDLAMTNADRLDTVSANDPIPPDLLAEITVDRLACGALDRLTRNYIRATKA